MPLRAGDVPDAVPPHTWRDGLRTLPSALEQSEGAYAATVVRVEPLG